MSDLYDRIVLERGGFEKLLARIPGFRGYLDLAARRAADRQIRDYVAEGLAGQLSRLASLQKRLLEQPGGLRFMSAAESARTQWQTYHDRVHTAAPGYSGFFALNKIDADDLEKIYAFDEAQVRYVDQLRDGLDAFEAAIVDAGDVAGAITSLESMGREANEAFRLRDTVLSSVGK
jgi:outer membrane receptor for Fe3+-dicitrate